MVRRLLAIMLCLVQVMPPALLWGAGTAIGEIPPYAFSYHAAKAGIRNEEWDNMFQVTPVSEGQGLIEALVNRMKNWMLRFIQKCALHPLHGLTASLTDAADISKTWAVSCVVLKEQQLPRTYRPTAWLLSDLCQISHNDSIVIAVWHMRSAQSAWHCMVRLYAMSKYAECKSVTCWCAGMAFGAYSCLPPGRMRSSTCAGSAAGTSSCPSGSSSARPWQERRL